MLELVRTVMSNVINEHFPRDSRGRPRSDVQDVLSSIDLVLRSGMAWRHLAHTKSSVHWSTVHGLFRKWTRAHIFEETYRRLLALRKRRPRRYCLDSSYVKNQYGRDVIGRNPTDRGRKATKISTIVDDTGVPISIQYFEGNVSDYKTVETTLENCYELLTPGTPLYADKGYDSQKVRQAIRSKSLVDRVGARGKRIHRLVNSKRTIVENFFARHDKCRRVIMRYDQQITSYASFTLICACRMLARAL